MNKKQRKSKKKRQRLRERPLLQHQKSSKTLMHQQASRRGPSDQAIPLWTKTGELFQPVRLYYAIRKPHKIRKLLEKLQCIRFEPAQDHWNWFYSGEASTLAFEKKSRAPQRPVKLGTFSFLGEHGLLLDVHSIERALAALSFFDRYFPHRLAKITHLSVVNSLFDSPHAHNFCFPICAQADATPQDPIVSILHKLDALIKKGPTASRQKESLEAYLQNLPSSPFPKIEHLAVKFSRKHQHITRFALESRQYVAIQHWKGNTHINQADYVRSLLSPENE